MDASVCFSVLFDPTLFREMRVEVMKYCSDFALATLARVSKDWEALARPLLQWRLKRGITWERDAEHLKLDVKGQHLRIALSKTTFSNPYTDLAVFLNRGSGEQCEPPYCPYMVPLANYNGSIPDDKPLLVLTSHPDDFILSSTSRGLRHPEGLRPRDVLERRHMLEVFVRSPQNRLQLNPLHANVTTRTFSGALTIQLIHTSARYRAFTEGKYTGTIYFLPYKLLLIDDREGFEDELNRMVCLLETVNLRFTRPFESSLWGE